MTACQTGSLNRINDRSSSKGIRRSYVDGRFGQMHVFAVGPTQIKSRKLAKTPLVCFHPTPMSSDYYRDYMLAMATDRLVIAIDTPGYGFSDRPPEPQTMEQYALAMADALDALGFGAAGMGAVDMMGYHTGVFIATELAILRPDLVRRLVLPGIPYTAPEDMTETYAAYAKPEPLTETGKGMQKAWAFSITEREPGVPLERAFDHFKDHVRALPYAWWAYHGVFSYPGAERLPMVTMPVLVPVSHGGLETETRTAGHLFPNATLIEMPELHHGIFDIKVPELVEVSRAFLDR
ncbi:MAG: alpha/beta fold hydrolase [Woeseiaceae bacterium]